MIRTIGALHVAMRKNHGDPKQQKPVEVAIKKRRGAPRREYPPGEDQAQRVVPASLSRDRRDAAQAGAYGRHRLRTVPATSLHP